jgi:hypothetical protein
MPLAVLVVADANIPASLNNFAVVVFDLFLDDAEG